MVRHNRIAITLQSVFHRVFHLHSMVPSFASYWGFNLASLGLSPLEMNAE